jgi:carboxyl-terminal processing protease
MDALWRQLVRNDRLELHLAGQSEDAIRKTLDARYADLSRRAHALRADEVVGAFANAFATSIDPAAAYYAPRDPQWSLAIDPSLVGIGMLVKREGPFVVVQSVVPGGPAARGDVHPGDRILAIGSGESGDWTDVVGARVDNVVEGMRGKPGTVSRLRLGSPAGARRDVALTRAPIQLADEVATRSLVVAGDRRIGVVTLPGFYLDFAAAQRGDPDARSSVGDVRRLLRELQAQGVDGVLLDLRGNGGGSLMESVEMAALFVGRAPVVQVRESGGRVSVESGSADAVWKGPVAVLVDEQSAAASEIFAAALQDHGRGVVLGARTFGRGSVQNLIDLDRIPTRNGERFGKVKITIADFYRADGRAIEGVGVAPDVPLPDARAADLRAGMHAEGKRIAAAPDFHPAVATPAGAVSVLEADPAYRAWRERWSRTRDIAAANALSLDAPTRRAAFAREHEDAQAARVRDDALQAAATVFAGGLGDKAH